MRITIALAALVALPFSVLAQNADGPIPAPAAQFKVAIERDVMVPMRDGVRLLPD